MSTILDQIKARKAAELAKVADKVGLVQTAPNPTPAVTVTVAATPISNSPAPISSAPAIEAKSSSPLKSILSRQIGAVSPLAKALAEIKQAPGPKPAAKPPVEAPITQSTPAKVSADQAAKFEAARQQLKQDILFLKNNMQNLPVIKMR